MHQESRLYGRGGAPSRRPDGFTYPTPIVARDQRGQLECFAEADDTDLTCRASRLPLEGELVG